MDHVKEPEVGKGKGEGKEEDLGLAEPIWTPDSQSKECQICGAEFTFTKR